MKELLSILTLLISFTFVSAQIDKVKTTYFPNGQIREHDSVYDCDTIKMVEKYYENLNNRKSVQICAKGEYLKIGEKSWCQYGNWKYWDQKGNLTHEELILRDSIGTRFINQNIPNRYQCLKNGNGYYTLFPSERTHTDSIIYEIKDSLRNGYYKKWLTVNDGKSYYLSEIGFYTNNEKDGFFINYYKNGKVKSIVEYNKFEIKNKFLSFYDNGNPMESGEQINNINIGLWKYWNKNGKIIKECNYFNGKLKGNYNEYFSNGNIKLKGIYIHIQIVDTAQIEDLDNPGCFYDYVFINSEYPVKDGEWKYFNEQGILVRSENYIKGKLIK